MAQDIFNTIDPTVVSGTELAGILDNFKEALMTGLSGPTRPLEVEQGGGWFDTSVANRLIFKIFTGTTDVAVFTINTVTNSVAIQGSDDYFEVAKISEDAVAPYVSFFKKRTTNQGQVKNGDVVGELSFKAASNTPNINYVVGRIRYVAMNDITSATQGGYYVFEGTMEGTAAITEFARFYNGRLALGVAVPLAALHIRSSTGTKVERVSDDATGVKTIIRKSRVSLNGQVQNNDELSSEDINSTDSAGTEFTAFRTVVTATENHTPTARGVKATVSSVDKNTNTPTEKYNISESGIELSTPLIRDALNKKIQQFASVSEVTALDAQKSFVEVTGTTAMTVRGISNSSKSKSFDFYNRTNQNIIFITEDLGVPEADRIRVNGEPTLTVQPGKRVSIQKLASTNRWHTLVEGNTGITFNEATNLIAKLVASSFIPDEVGRSYALVDSSPPSNAATYSGIIPTTLSANLQGVGIVGQTFNNSSIGVAIKEHLKGAWAAGYSSDSSVQVSLPDEVWARSTTFSLSGTANTLAIRPSGTRRSIRAFYVNPSITARPSAAVDLMNIHSTSEWVDIDNNGSHIVAVSRGGTNRVARIAIVAGDIGTNNWSYVSSATIDVPLRSVAYGGGKWVAVGGVIGASSNHSAWTSTDGLSWTSYAMPNESTVQYNLVRYCNTQFVAVGGTSAAGMVILTSPDGQTWTQRATASVGITINDVSYGGGVYIAYTDQNIAIISTDGVNWSEVPSLAVKSVKYIHGYGFLGCPNNAAGPVIYRTLCPSI